MEAEDCPHVLVERAQAGDRDAFGELSGKYRDRLGSFIRKQTGARLRHRLEVEDVLQETFTRAFQALERFQWQEGDSFFRWLSRIAERVILEGARGQERDPQLGLTSEIRRSEASPSRLLRRDERFDRFQKAIECLSPEHREVILLARIDGLKVKEIAERMGRSPDAIKQLLSRGLKKLKLAFGETESLHLPDRRLSDEGVIGGDGQGS